MITTFLGAIAYLPPPLPSHAYKPTPPPTYTQLELIETFQLRGTDINFLVYREIGQAERIKFM